MPVLIKAIVNNLCLRDYGRDGRPMVDLPVGREVAVVELHQHVEPRNCKEYDLRVVDNIGNTPLAPLSVKRTPRVNAQKNVIGENVVEEKANDEPGIEPVVEEKEKAKEPDVKPAKRRWK